ncbi:hypothetical protein GE09DRAFT_1123277 [Coniochaeta sp. 2T2.1]|nr:hypothetical protein GE09DRAFT_1123277 [Coniochaeta sp. 2T2.1]
MLHNSLLIAATVAATLVTSISASKCQCRKIPDVDVAILGGGAAGSYAAAELQAVHNKKVIVVDVASRLGGHVDTVPVPGQETPIDFGVLGYNNLSVVRDFFAAHDVNLIPDPGFVVGARVYLDQKTAKPVELTQYSDEEFAAALDAWVKFGRKYEKHVAPAYNLPSPIGDAAPLLRPFGETVEELGLEPILWLLPDAHFANDLLALPTLFAISSFGYIWFDGEGAATVVPESRNNTELYLKIQTELGADRVLLNTHIQSVRRNRKTGTTTIVTKGPAGCTEITAKQVIVGFVPTAHNMRPFDTTREEDRLWSKWECVNLFNGLVTIEGFPDATSISPASPDPQRGGLAVPPNVRFINRGGTNFTHVWITGSPEDRGLSDAKKRIDQRIKAINKAGQYELGEDVTYWGLSDHAPLACSVSPEDMAAGFWMDVNRLQGSDGIWYVGQAFTGDLTAMVWEQTRDVVGKLVQKL